MTCTAKAIPAALAIAAMFASAAPAQTPPPGREAYVLYCGQCHGASGKGDGPLRQVLTTAPSDLTTLQRRNSNEFPFYRVFLMVDGRSLVPAHGTREMPVWGGLFALEAERFGPFGGETYVRGRVVEIVRYIETLQQ
ncbi:cytochrome c [Roseomonas sp. AR75]|jgi:hypothetical protein|uniref:c-type cytochrome n=1 Tax=Roseomonas sp. AR75 TaxID=2562311 RepID=UPI0010C07100|nr:cytochrome c [Roseomonas sp. AR75]